MGGSIAKIPRRWYNCGNETMHLHDDGHGSVQVGGGVRVLLTHRRKAVFLLAGFKVKLKHETNNPIQ